jgi:hypothetical protein
MTTPGHISEADGYWDNRFKNDDTPWDMGTVSPPLKAYADQLKDKTIKILIPGCGNSYEAEYLLQQGFTHITLIDIAPSLTRRLEEKFKDYLGRQLHIITGDFFALTGSYDLILEQTFLSALPPHLRQAYAAQVKALLRPGGRQAGILFSKNFDADGPPFGGTIEEYRLLFAPLFRIVTLEPCYNSVKPREGSECFFILQKK